MTNPVSLNSVSAVARTSTLQAPAKQVTTKTLQGTNPSEELVEAPKKSRRRLIDPTTCERDYSQDEVEFMKALDDYKRKNNRMFPTCSEILEVIRQLGYVKLTEEYYPEEYLQA